MAGSASGMNGGLGGRPGVTSPPPKFSSSADDMLYMMNHGGVDGSGKGALIPLPGTQNGPVQNGTGGFSNAFSDSTAMTERGRMAYMQPQQMQQGFQTQMAANPAIPLQAQMAANPAMQPQQMLNSQMRPQPAIAGDNQMQPKQMQGGANSPAMQQGQYNPLAPQGDFNLNQASAGAMQRSMEGAQNGMQFDAGQLAGSDLSQYTNPYENQVVQQTLTDLGGAQEQQLNQMGANATAAGAFGGSRHGIAEAETRRGFADTAAQTVSGLRQAGYTQAGQAAQNDINNRMASEQMRMNAGSQLSQYGNQAFNTGQTIQQNQMQQGLLQQGLQQSLIDAARGQYQGFTNSPNAALAAPLAALGQTPTPQTTTKTNNPGLFDYLGAGLAMAPMISDTRLKTDVKPIGAYKGINLYTWNWNDEGKRIADPAQSTVGVMAQELRETHPHLVKAGSDGYLRVNYAGLNSELEAA